MNFGLPSALGQPALAYPRGFFRFPSGATVPSGNTFVERIVPAIRHARVPGPTLAGISSPFVSPASSPGSFLSVPLNSPVSSISSQLSSESLYTSVSSRLASLASRVGSAASSSIAAAGRGLASMGPLGVAIGVAAVVAAAIGGLGYYLYQRSQMNLSKMVDAVVDKVLPPEGRPLPPTDEHEDLPPFDPWLANVPWQRRPGRDLTLAEIFQRAPVLSMYFNPKRG
jgi:hypothetical protein